MKKNLLSKLAACLTGFAILAVCGAIVTSCSKDDDNNSSSPETPSEETPSVASKYDITLTLFTYKTLSDYVDYEFSYTDHNGKTSTPVKLTGKESGESLTDKEAIYYEELYKARITEAFPESKYLEYVAFHYTIKDVPKGSEISWETIQHTAEGATAPTEALKFVWPSVMITTKAGNVVRNKMVISEGIVSARLDQWFESVIKAKEGRTFPYASGSITVGDQL